MGAKRLLVLVVDDEAPVRQIAALTLASAGYDVLTAPDGVEALACALQHQNDLDLVLTDVQMPNMDGLALAHQLSQNCPQIRILIMSGYTEKLGQVKASRYPFLAKPFGAAGLLKSVQAILSHRQDEPESRTA